MNSIRGILMHKAGNTMNAKMLVNSCRRFQCVEHFVTDLTHTILKKENVFL